MIQGTLIFEVDPAEIILLKRCDRPNTGTLFLSFHNFISSPKIAKLRKSQFQKDEAGPAVGYHQLLMMDGNQNIVAPTNES